MYETEVNTTIESADQIPAEALASFGQLRGRISSRTVLPWSEHCTECVWPTCYSTCDLYSSREDGRCRRFVDGMVRINCPSAVNRYILKIRFKQWGKLWTPGVLRLQPVDQAERLENRDRWIGNVLYQIPLPAPLKKAAVEKRYGFKKRMAQRKGDSDAAGACFLLECFNPAQQMVSLSLTIRSFQGNNRIPFQKLIDLHPGYNLVRVPSKEISNAINLGAPFNVELIPNEIGQEITLFFGLMDFVQEVASATRQSKVKCVVWDLDRTLWDGILVEDGPEKVRLKPGIIDTIKELDRRGILQSVASKNNHDEVMRLLKEFGIEEFFLYPQVSWRPKSESLDAIARLLNIGIDTLLFIDDSEFELQQVQSVHSKVRVLNANEYSSLLDRSDCQSPVTGESMRRRIMYQVEQSRQQVAASFKDDYRAFLMDCNIHLEIAELSEDNMERVHELTQRTNQMNFSGNRYDRALLREVLQNSHLDTYVLSCKDRFGSYGIIGFGIVDNREPRLTDLMFSCRIQAKRVEHAFLSYILRKYISLTGRNFHADYRKTPRNAPSGQVFADMGMQEVGVSDGVTQLVFSKEHDIFDDGIVTLNVHDTVSAGDRQ
jgi:FkbH-like protein